MFNGEVVLPKVAYRNKGRFINPLWLAAFGFSAAGKDESC